MADHPWFTHTVVRWACCLGAGLIVSIFGVTVGGFTGWRLRGWEMLPIALVGAGLGIGAARIGFLGLPVGMYPAVLLLALVLTAAAGGLAGYGFGPPIGPEQEGGVLYLYYAAVGALYAGGAGVVGAVLWAIVQIVLFHRAWVR
jgi:hypothetical protein